jgi:hypothetical protein
MIAVRDSKDPSQGMLLYTDREWECFVLAVRNGEFDNPA